MTTEIDEVEFAAVRCQDCGGEPTTIDISKRPYIGLCYECLMKSIGAARAAKEQDGSGH